MDEIFEKTLQKLLRFLSLRPRSSKEIRERVGKYLKKFSQTEREVLFTRIWSYLEKENLLDDYAFTKWWVEQRIAFKPKGRIALFQELRSKGIEKNVFEEVWQKEFTSSFDEETQMRVLADKKINRYKNLTREKFYRRFSNFFLQRGFSPSLVHRIVDEMWQKEVK